VHVIIKEGGCNSSIS